MVYKIFNEGSHGKVHRKRQPTGKAIRARPLQIKSESLLANVLLSVLRLILFIYDVISLPIYFILQRPDRRAKEEQRTRSEQVGENTWMKIDRNLDEIRYLLHENKLTGNSKFKHKFMGLTQSEIFGNAIREYSSRSCLGYRAVVTCPVLSLNEEGKHVLQDKSFRSDYTWYTFDQIGRRVQDIASGLEYHCSPPNSRALFMASTSLEWFCAAQACFQLGIQLVVAPEINDHDSLRLVLREAEIGVVFVSCDRLQQLSRLMETIKSADDSDSEFRSNFKLRQIVIIDWLFSVDLTEAIFAELRNSANKSVELLSIGQIEESGVENPIEFSCTRSLKRFSATSDDTSDYFNKLVSGNVNLAGEDTDCPSDYGKQQLYRRRRRSTGHDQAELIPFLAEESIGTDRNCKQLGIASSLSEADLRDESRRSIEAKLGDQVTNERVDRTINPSKPNDPAMIVYTHGQIGQLKAVILTHDYLARSNDYLFLDGMVQAKDIHCATLSLDNVIEFMTEMCVFSHGGSIGYSCNSNTLFYDGKDLFERDRSDLEALNPTFLLTRPYILERLRGSIQNYMSLNLNPLKGFVLNNLLYDYKKFWARRHFTTPIVDRLFCSELKRLFGRNLEYILCNGATDSSETKDFFAFMVNLPVIELYGPEEAIVSLISVTDIWDYKRRRIANAKLCKTTTNGKHAHDESREAEVKSSMQPDVDKFKVDNSMNLLITSSILCPTLGSRIRLEDWEDFKMSDLPYPRGRLLIGGDVVCKGYYKRPEATLSCFQYDSNLITWFKTQDIARVFPNGSFEIISAITDMMKMADGQFISLSQIEHILRNSQFVENVCAICSDERNFVIALVVPNLRRLALKSPGEADLKMAMGTEPEPEELIDIEFRREVCNDRLLCEFVNNHLQTLVAEAGFQSIPSRFHLVPEIWTPETELVTPSFEPKRGAIQRYYANEIQSIFKMTHFDPSKATRLSARLGSSRKRPKQMKTTIKNTILS